MSFVVLLLWRFNCVRRNSLNYLDKKCASSVWIKSFVFVTSVCEHHLQFLFCNRCIAGQKGGNHIEDHSNKEDRPSKLPSLMNSEAERNDTNEWSWNNCWNTRNRVEWKRHFSFSQNPANSALLWKLNLCKSPKFICKSSKSYYVRRSA